MQTQNTNIKINWQQKINASNQNIIPVDLDFIIAKIKSPDREVLKSIKIIRETKDNNVIKKEKLKLPAFLCGEYENNLRSSKSFLSSNAMIFDFDDLDLPVIEAKEKLNNIKNLKPLLIFISPRGTRLKAIYQCDNIFDIETYKETYSFYAKKLSQLGFIADTTNKEGKQEPNKLCFTSYDQDLIYNKENHTILEIVKPKDKEVKKPINKQIDYLKYLNTTDEIQEARRVLSYIQGNPQYFDWLVVYSACCKKFGLSVGKELCQEYMPEIELGEYDRKARNILTKYSWGSVVNMAKANGYEPPRKTKTGKKIIANDKIYEIVNKKEVLKETLKETRNILTKFPQFWISGEKPVIDYNNLLTFLEFVGFRQNMDGEGYYRIIDNIVYKYNTEEEVKKVFMEIIEPIDNEEMKRAVRTPHLGFIKAQLTSLKQIRIKKHTDTRNATYFYFRNCVLEITKKEIKKIDYKDLDGYVFSNNIINFDYDINKYKEYERNDFYNFLFNIANKDNDRFNALLVNIGYLLSRFKKESEAVAICLQEEDYSITADGGTGKGLIRTAISKVRNVASVDGKKDMDYKFVYEAVTENTDVLCISDVKADFDFDRNFNMVTDEMIIDRKNKTQLILEFAKSPKILFSTNHRIKTEGASAKRRMTKYSLSHYYGDHKKPIEDFKRDFFSEEWTNSDWNSFYSMMFFACQLYLFTEKTIPFEVGNECYNSLRYTLKYPDILDFIDYELETNENIVYEAIDDLYFKFYSKYNVNIHKYEKKDFEKDLYLIIKTLKYETKEVGKKRSSTNGGYPYKAIWFKKSNN